MSSAGRIRGLVRRARGTLDALKWAVAPEGTVRVQGHRMYLDASDSLGLGRKGYHELPETRLINRLIRRGDTVVDVGANIGYYTLLFARLVGRTGKVYAFEPDPTNFSILNRNVALNGYDNVVLSPVAVSSREGTTELFLCDHNAGMHRTYRSILCNRSLQVEAISLDSFLKNEKREIGLIKIDIEGAERPALEGMRSLLARSRRTALLSEYSPAAIRECGSDPDEYIRTLLDLGFKPHTVGEAGRAVPVDVREIRESTRRILHVTEEVLRPLGENPEDPSAVITTIATRLRESGHHGGLTRNLLFIKSSGEADAGSGS